MDPPAPGPGPPRNIAPAPPEPSLPIFPFNHVHQPVNLQIAPSHPSIPLPHQSAPPFQSSQSFPNPPFLPNNNNNNNGTSGNNNSSNNPTPQMLQNPNPPSQNQQTQPPSNIPHSTHQHHPQTQSQPFSNHTSRDFFGELEQALSASNPTSSNAPDFDVLDHAITPSNQNPSSTHPPLPPSIQPWSHSQSQSQPMQAQPPSHLHQTHLQAQLQQQHQQQQMRQRQLQQRAHIAQHHQQLRHQHLQTQQLRQQQFRQQQQHLGQLRHLQPQPQQHNLAMINHSRSQQLQQHQVNNHTVNPSQPQQSQQMQQPIHFPQQSPHMRAQPMQQYAPKHIQPAVILPNQPQASIAYPAGYVAQSSMASTAQPQNASGNPSMTVGAAQSLAASTAIQQTSGTPSQPTRSKSKTKKTSQRRPRAKSQSKTLQGRNSQSQSPSPSQTSSQHTSHAAQVAQLPRHPSQEQMNAFARQQQFASPPQHIQPSPSPVQQTQQQIQQARKHELQTRLLQQRQMPHHLNQRQPALAPGSSPSFVPSPSVPPAKARASLPHRGANVQQSVKSSPLAAMQASQSTGFGSQVSQGQMSQLPGNELASLAKFDGATLQKILSRTSDPKVYAMLQEQLRMRQGNATGQGLSHEGTQNPLNLQTHMRGAQKESAATTLSHGRPPSGSPQSAGMGSVPMTRAATILGHQQLVQQEQGVTQLHQQQSQPLRQKQGAPAVAQQLGAPQIFPRGMPLRQQTPQQSFGVLDPHASQSMASLPQHVQHQIQARIQAQHIQTQLQNQAKLNTQRSAAAGSPSFHNVSQHLAPVPPRRSPSPSEARRPRKSPKSSRQNDVVSHANGSVPTSRNAHNSAKPIALSEASGLQPSAQSDPFSLHTSLSTRPSPQSPARSSSTYQMSTISPRNENTQIPQGSSALREMELRRDAERKKLVAEQHKRRRESELRDIARTKKARLNSAPTSDYQGVLAPDYKKPFSGQVNAWLRLVPFHVLNSKDDDSISSEEWDKGITNLSNKYRKDSTAIERKVRELHESKLDFEVDDVPGLGTGLLSVQDSIVMDTVVLEDFNETVRQERALAESRAREMAKQRAIEIEASRKAAEQAARAAAAARVASMQADRTQTPSAQPGRGQASTGVGAFGQELGDSIRTSGVQSGLPIGSQALRISPQSTLMGSAPAQIITTSKGNNVQSHFQHITGNPSGTRNMISRGDAGYADQVTTTQPFQTQSTQMHVGSKAQPHVQGHNSSGLSLAFQHAQQAAMPQSQLIGYQVAGQVTRRQIIPGHQNLAPMSSARTPSQASPNHSGPSASVQHRIQEVGLLSVPGGSNGMNNGGSGPENLANKALVGSRSGASGTPPHGSQLPMIQHAGPQVHGGGIHGARPQSHAAQTHTAGGNLPLGYHGNGMGIGQGINVSHGSYAGHLNNVRGGRGAASSSMMMRGQLPTYPASMQAGGTQMPVEPQTERAGGVSTAPTASSVAGQQGAKGSGSNSFGMGRSGVVSMGQPLGSNGGNATNGAADGGKESRSMGMGSLLNVGRR